MPWANWRTSTLRRPSWTTTITLLGCLAIPFLIFNTASFGTLQGKLVSVIKVDGSKIEPSEYYDWNTRSAFHPVQQSVQSNESAKELCRSFPTHLLDDVQPILKTGHGVLRDRLRLQLQSVSACLTNLLIFSDLDETFQGHDVINVIADLPDVLKEHEQLEAWRVLNAAFASGTPDNSTTARKDGWESDKFKFLPSISRAWMMRPEKRWYIFYEADTYLVWDNIFRLLENFDPDRPWYFGSPSPGGQGVWFANGGPGFILSREAMRKLVEKDWDAITGEYLGTKLTERHWDTLLHDCCGDSVLGTALAAESVTISGLWPEFNPHPPHGIPFSDSYWCQPIISMHKPRAEDIISLWRWQWENRQLQRPLLYRDLAVSYFDISALVVTRNHDNADWDGFDPPPTTGEPQSSADPHASPTACDKACELHHECFQWTYHLRRCTFVRSFRYGRRREPEVGGMKSNGEGQSQWEPEDLVYTSGWIRERISKWMDERQCTKVQWVRPSIRRIF